MKVQYRYLACGALVSATALMALAAGSGTAMAQQKDLVTVVLAEEPDNIDGCNANRSATGRVVRNNVVEAMAEINPADGSLQPRLALSWEQIDPKRWRFHLRKGVTFHDGAPFNAETAAKAMARTLNPNTDCETRQKFFGKLKVVGEPVDEYTLDVVADQPVPILPTYMGALMLSSPNLPVNELSTPVGTGPYKFVSWNSGHEIRLTRNDNWWGKKPDVKDVRYIWRGESAVRAAMVKIGEADIAPVVAVQDATDPTMDFSYPNSETSWLRIDTHLAPLNDVRVRKALNLAIDRNALRGSIFSKDVIPAAQAVFPPIPGHNVELDKQIWPYDPEQAKKLLAEAKAAGVPVDKEIIMYGRLGIYPNATEVMETFLAWYKEIGLNVKLRMVEVGEWRRLHTAPYAQDRPPNLVQTMHDNNNGDPVFTVQFKYSCEGANSTYCDPALDEKIFKAATLTGQARFDLYKEIFKEVYLDKVVDVMMFHMVGYSRVNPRIDFRPTVSMNTEVQISQVKLK